MIRGSIEVAERGRVSGWIYASAEPVRDKLILAFVGPRCVGAGKVDRFRKDLLEAKLGDGYCGFDFPLNLNDDENVAAVVIKLQNADAALIQASSRIIGAGDVAASSAADLGAIDAAGAAWMQDRGWLDQPEHDFLKAVQNIGAYERGLRPPRRAGAPEGEPLNPRTVAAELLALYALGDVDVAASKVASLSELAGDAAPLLRGGISAMAIWSPERGRICVDERSHLTAGEPGANLLAAPPSGGIDHAFGPDRLLFLHKSVAFAPQGPAPAAGVTVFTATRRAASGKARPADAAKRGQAA